ncbi:hypothetical protein PENTCL1PPCAC_12076, partial [Pristionchus entomophagus]
RSGRPSDPLDLEVLPATSHEMRPVADPVGEERKLIEQRIDGERLLQVQVVGHLVLVIGQCESLSEDSRGNGALYPLGVGSDEIGHLLRQFSLLLWPLSQCLDDVTHFL